MPLRDRLLNFAADGPLQSTMRELQGLFFSPLLWALLATAAFLLGLVGPFGTFDELGLPGRVAYWAAIVVATYFAGLGTVYWTVFTWRGSLEWGPVVYGIAGAAAGLPVALVVTAINAAVFGPGSLNSPGLWSLAGYCIAISAAVSAMVAAVSLHFARASAPDTTTGRRPRILERLPPPKRGTLSHLTVQDHYVEIRTDKGGELVLMRLADAIAETEGVEGLRIHRSHWVAIDAVAASLRRGGQLHLKMRDGTVLPVSRTYLADVRAAGFR